MTKKILVAGGAGYIGSHMVACLLRAGYESIVADSLVTGHSEAVKGARLLEGDLRDRKFLREIFSENEIDGVIDFAAFSLVPESAADPLKYYSNNVVGAIEMLDVMREFGVSKIVFSSTAATYGEQKAMPIAEDAQTSPTNPYGETKLAIEKMLKWCDEAYGIKYAALRYFNAAGADNAAGIGEDHSPETHLIPNVLKAALGQRDYVEIFGDDYPTPDGSCIRDYIHILDLVRAHLLAYEHLSSKKESGIFNLGSGSGFSVKEIVEQAREITGKEIPARISPRRAGDSSTLVASNLRAKEVLGWQPELGLKEIIQSAWHWHGENPKGYAK
ncbi:MAG: UDP-glucose 4-epimerase GalE [Christensenellales bacterium]